MINKTLRVLLVPVTATTQAIVDRCPNIKHSHVKLTIGAVFFFGGEYLAEHSVHIEPVVIAFVLKNFFTCCHDYGVLPILDIFNQIVYDLTIKKKDENNEHL